MVSVSRTRYNLWCIVPHYFEVVLPKSETFNKTTDFDASEAGRSDIVVSSGCSS